MIRLKLAINKQKSMILIKKESIGKESVPHTNITVVLLLTIIIFSTIQFDTVQGQSENSRFFRSWPLNRYIVGLISKIFTLRIKHNYGTKGMQA